MKKQDSCFQCGGLLKGCYQFNTCSACYSKNVENARPLGATHKLYLPDLTTIYYRLDSHGNWSIWSKIEKECDHWVKAAGVSENLLVKL